MILRPSPAGVNHETLHRSFSKLAVEVFSLSSFATSHGAATAAGQVTASVAASRAGDKATP
jgi:hypothetical protein